MATVYMELPPLESGFGIELNLLLPFNAGWSQIYTYYNHGLEPPDGGIKSNEFTEDAEFEVEDFDNLLRYTDKWVAYISAITGNIIAYNPDLPLEYKANLQENGDLVMNTSIEMETLDSMIIWSKNTGKITLKARDAFDLSWSGFLFYAKCLKDFSAKIKEQ
jgi:hypothetical protein